MLSQICNEKLYNLFPLAIQIFVMQSFSINLPQMLFLIVFPYSALSLHTESCSFIILPFPPRGMSIGGFCTICKGVSDLKKVLKYPWTYNSKVASESVEPTLARKTKLIRWTGPVCTRTCSATKWPRTSPNIAERTRECYKAQTKPNLISVAVCLNHTEILNVANYRVAQLVLYFVKNHMN